MTFPNFLTSITVWCLTTALTFTSTMARYLVPQLEATINTIKNDNNPEPSIWKQHIYCVSNRVYIKRKDFLQILKELKGNVQIFRTGRGHYFYNKIECETYGPIIAVGFIASLLGSILLFKLWTKYHHSHAITTSSLPNEQEPFLTTPPNLQQQCATADKNHTTPPSSLRANSAVSVL